MLTLKNFSRLSLIGAMLLAASQAPAQSVGGQSGISGTVKDASGAVVPNAKVVVSSASQGQLRSTVTNSAGVFAAPGLTPGSGFEVTVTAAGFAPYEMKDIVLQVGQNMDLSVSLSVGQAATAVEVNEAAQLIEDT